MYLPQNYRHDFFFKFPNPRSADGAEADQNQISETMADLKSNDLMETSEVTFTNTDPPIFMAVNVQDQEVIVGDNNPNKSCDVVEFVRDDAEGKKTLDYAILNSSIAAPDQRELETDQIIYFEAQDVEEVIVGDNNPNKSFDIAEFVRNDAIFHAIGSSIGADDQKPKVKVEPRGNRFLFSIADDQNEPEIKIEPSDRKLEIDPDFNISPKPPKRKYLKSGTYVKKSSSTSKMTAKAAKIEIRDERNAAVSKIKSAIPGMSPKIENAAAVEIAVKYIESIQIKLDSKKEVEFYRYDRHRRLMEP